MNMISTYGEAFFGQVEQSITSEKSVFAEMPDGGKKSFLKLLRAFRSLKPKLRLTIINMQGILAGHS